ncbi:hypothetical protein C2845_PM12G12850 [Panicum miliaceum]|uniref:Transposon protein, putative, CACTA, En/Spm sub-class n=1 Tax=Panicum miliaceum TaxID=4540 RepID=A0A3L6QEM2_PANMI|nr:hypothetical protein C2845_PM12G12850 [Panicum miliaceum]
MNPRGDEDANQFLMDMIAGGDAHHVEEGAGDDASNTDIYLNMSGDGIEQSEDGADQQTENPSASENPKRGKRGWTKRLEGRYIITEVVHDGEPITPANVAGKYKKYHHALGQGGYKVAIPKWEKMEEDLLAIGTTPATINWLERSRNWYYAHGRSLNPENGECIFGERIQQATIRLQEAIEVVA